MDGWLDALPGIGAKRARALTDAGLATPQAILERFPMGYRDWDNLVPLCALRAGESRPFFATVARVASRPPSGGVSVTRVWVEDQTGALLLVYFNQPYRASQLRRGECFLFYGRIERGPEGLQAVCPIVAAGGRKRGIEPVYRPIEGVPAGVYHGVVRDALERADMRDALPDCLRAQYGLMERRDALRALHFPGNMASLERARRRIDFEHLFLFQIATRLARGLAPKRGIVIQCGEADMAPLNARLPYALTGAQRRVTAEILADMAAAPPMARLVQGDVGSGKTVVAFLALYAAAKAGFQAALMAPTEVLVAQHEAAARALLEPLGMRIGRLTGSHTAAERKRSLRRIAQGEWDIVIGTHALFVKDVAFFNLGLVITDEQHRFGVGQRAALSQKGDAPNVLVMSATPIPRSLALILYGDLSISVIDEMPPGRRPVETRVVPEHKRAGMYGFIEQEVKKGRQCYVVCPLVEESEAVDAASAVQTHALAAAAMPSARCALLHGRMAAKTKEGILAAFERGDIDVLVSTTVIEVGINVPNATIMVIENAERFGLAQLHQLRGRVGRGAHASWCFLMAQRNERLDALTQTNDGFIIAQKDLELRGPGDIYGLRQSGAPGAMEAALGADARLIEETQRAVDAYLAMEGPPGFDEVKAAAEALIDGGGAAYHIN